MDWTPLINSIAVALVSGVISGLVAYGGLAIKLEWLRADMNKSNADAVSAKELAQEAIRVAEKALFVAERRGG